MVPPILLSPQSEECILDLGAAPGSKTLQLAELMGNQGSIWAVESVRGRFFRLRDNLARYGAENVQTHLADGTRLWRRHPERFDRVLLDAPCSSEGRFRADAPKTYAYWSEKKIAEASRKQRRLCYAAVQCLKPGGVLVYSTCTFAPEENEAIINRVLRQFAGALTVEDIALPFDQCIVGLEPVAEGRRHLTPKYSEPSGFCRWGEWRGSSCADCARRRVQLATNRSAKPQSPSAARSGFEEAPSKGVGNH